MSTTTESLPTPVNFAPRRVGHGNFFVSDLVRSSKFYVEVLGLQQVFHEPGIGASFFSNGNSHHDVGLIQIPQETLVGRDGQVQIPAKSDRRPGLNHIGFEMETEAQLVAAYQRAVRADVNIHRTVDHQISHSVYVWDPDGNYLEFYADAEHDWRGVYAKHENALLTGTWDPTLETASQEPKYNVAPSIQRVQGAPLRPVRAARASLEVSDLQALTAFYRDVVGMSVVLEDTAQGFAILSGTVGYWDLGLFEVRDGAKPGMHHFGFELDGAEELSEVAARLRDAGTPLVAEVSSPTKDSVALRDPDGILLEFFVEKSRSASDVVTGANALPFLV